LARWNTGVPLFLKDFAIFAVLQNGHSNSADAIERTANAKRVQKSLVLSSARIIRVLQWRERVIRRCVRVVRWRARIVWRALVWWIRRRKRWIVRIFASPNLVCRHTAVPLFLEHLSIFADL
jgi:hypothetical protein